VEKRRGRLVREGRGLRVAAVGDALDLDQVRRAAPHQLRVRVELGVVPAVDERQPEDRALPLAREQADALVEPLPKVGEERPVHRLELLTRGRVDGDVELRARNELLHLLGELRVGHHEGGDAAPVQLREKRVDARVDDRLADQREGAVADAPEGVLEPLGQDAWHAAQRLDHLEVLTLEALDELVRVVDLPAEGGADRVVVVPPAKDALVCAREGRCRLHARVRGDAYQILLTAAALRSQSPPPSCGQQAGGEEAP